MANNQAVPEWMEIGESGGGALDDAADGTRSRSFTLKVLMGNLDGYDAAEARLLRLAPLVRRGHRRVSARPEPVGAGWYVGTVEYRNESIVVRNGFRFSGWEWETNEKQEHITQFWNERDANGVLNPNKYVVAYEESPSGPHVPGTGNEPDLHGAIGVQDDQVRGIEKPVALFNWQETWICPAEYIVKQRPERTVTEIVNGNPRTISLSTAPIDDLAGPYAFCTNKYAFRNKPPGCVLLTSIRTGRMNQGSTCVTMTLSFSYSPLRENFCVGDIPIDKKDGWDYLDVYYQTEVDTTELVKKPKYVYIGRVFDRVDFRDLGVADPLPQWWLNDDKLGHQFDSPFGA